MLKRVGGALTAMLALAGLAVPGALLAGAVSRASAATAQPARPAQPATSAQAATSAQLAAKSRRGASTVGIAVTGLSPAWAGPKSTITVTGTLTNNSKQQASNLTVQLFASASPIASIDQFAQSTAVLDTLAGTILPGASWQSSGQLAPGSSVNWQIKVKASALGMATFGAYPLAAQVQNAAGVPLSRTTTYLPYIPAKKSPYSYSRPRPQKIAWVWPLIDSPLLNQPWQNNCRGSQAEALARSLSPGGRLAGLLSAGAQAAKAAGAGSPAGAAGPGLTWAIDPALLANVRALTTCRGSAASLARPASAWLTELKAATTGQPVFVTPYADVNVATLIRLHHETDVSYAMLDGRAIASRVLRRNLVLPAHATSAAQATTSAGPSSLAAADSATAFAWPADGIEGLPTLESLAGRFGVRTVLLSNAGLVSMPSTVVRTEDNVGGYANILLISQPITDLLGSASGAQGSAFATSQQFLAETAVLAAQPNSGPIIVAPPRRWQPPAGLAASALADSAAAPWLAQVSLPSLTTQKRLPMVQAPTTTVGQAFYSRRELHLLAALDRGIKQLWSIRARPNDDVYLPVATIESSAWHSASQATARAMLTQVAQLIAPQQRPARCDGLSISCVRVIAELRVTLGGLKGRVPVSIDNSLGYAVKVRVVPQFSLASGVKIHVDPPGLVTVAAGTDKTIHLRVQAAQVGSTTVTMRLVNRFGEQLPGSPARMTIQATQVGVLGMIIFACALGVFLIASAARAVRRGPTAPAADQPPDRPGHQADDQAAAQRPDDHAAPTHAHDAGATAAEPDTVMAERSELGTAGTPGL